MIRIVHALGGCGSTLISRCLAVLPAVALLSEINPNSVNLFSEFHPLYQDLKYLHLLHASDRERFSQIDVSTFENFRQLMQTFLARARAAKRYLILRDYNYVDFIGVPYVSKPSRRRIIYDALPDGIPTASVVLIRHPIDQWISLSKHEHVGRILSPAVFCDAYDEFLSDVGHQRLYKYEDFVACPASELRAMCSDLALAFDPSFVQRFQTFDSLTGDFSRRHDCSISLPKKKVPPPAVLEEFRSSGSFWRILRATGYTE